MFKELLNARREKKLGDAIANHDLKAMTEYLNLGVKKVDYMQMRMADFGDGTMKVPACKFNDAWTLAEAVGMKQEGLAILQRYIPRENGPSMRTPSY